MATPTKTDDGADLRKRGRKWLDRIEDAGKAEKKWLDDAKKAVQAYTGESLDSDVTVDGYDFNILFSNVETIVPAVINSPPAPDIRRRFGDADEAARTVAEIIERAIRLQVDDSRLQVELEASAQDSFLAGRGIVRLRFHSDIVTSEPSRDDIEDASDAQDDRPNGKSYLKTAGEPDEGLAGLGESEQPEGSFGEIGRETVENERIRFEAVSWCDYRHGPAKRWDERPWDAFRFCIQREDEEKSFDRSVIKAQLSETEFSTWTTSAKDLTGWEIWCKDSRKVIFIDDNGVILKEIEDPLGLSGFFPIATPMQPIEINGRLMPVNPFSVYRNLADKLDKAVLRKGKLIAQLKVKGAYGGSPTDIAALVNAGDGDFVPIENAEMWAQNGGLEGAIAWWPIEKYVLAIQQLDAAIAQYKQWIYEITGISDIVRGASLASETATAQNIKSQWGSLRIQKMQRMMERCARDLFVMMSELIPAKFSPQALEKMTGVPIIPTPEDPPEVIQNKMAVLELMKQRLSAYYRIDVESDSTVRADLTRQKQEVAEFLNGAAAYLKSVGPMIQSGQIPADVAMEIFAANARLFNLGKSVEDTIEGMITKARETAKQPPAAQQPTPEQIAAQAKAQSEQARFQMDAERAQAEDTRRQQEFEAKMTAEAQKVQQQGAEAQRAAIMAVLEEELKRLDIAIKSAELQAKEADAAKKAAEAANVIVPNPMAPTGATFIEAQ